MCVKLELHTNNYGDTKLKRNYILALVKKIMVEYQCSRQSVHKRRRDSQSCAHAALYSPELPLTLNSVWGTIDYISWEIQRPQENRARDLLAPSIVSQTSFVSRNNRLRMVYPHFGEFRLMLPLSLTQYVSWLQQLLRFWRWESAKVSWMGRGADISIPSMNFQLTNVIKILKNTVFWDVVPRGSCKNWHYGGRYRLHHQGDKNRRARHLF
jgi:hypothetical protein